MPPTDAVPRLLALSNAAALLALLAVGAALVLPEPYAAVPDALRPGAWSQDVVTVAAALALLGLAPRLRARGGAGWLVWAGLVGYLVYAYGLYSFDRVVNEAYLVYVAILCLATAALVLFARAVDPAAVVAPGRAPPRRATAVLFGVLVALFASLWTASLLPAMRAREPLPGQTIFVLDLAFALPLLALAAALLWRERPLGDVLAPPLLVKAATLGISVFLGTLFGALGSGGPVPAFDLALYALMGFGPALLAAPYLRRLDARPPPDRPR